MYMKFNIYYICVRGRQNLMIMIQKAELSHDMVSIFALEKKVYFKFYVK